MRKILLLLLLLCLQNSFAQLPISLLENTKANLFFQDYEGSIYTSKNYKLSSIVQENTGAYEGKIRYNIYDDRMEHKKENQLYTIQKKENIHIKIDDEYFYYCNFIDMKGFKKHGYYVLVELTNSYKIYKKYTLKIVDPTNTQKVNNQLAEAGKLRKRVTYFLEEGNKITELPMKEKDLLAKFSDQKDNLKSYIKKQKIRFRKEEDLIRFVSKYKMLLSDNPYPSGESILTNLSH